MRWRAISEFEKIGHAKAHTFHMLVRHLASVVVLLMAGAFCAPTAQADPIVEHVNLGDSFSAGSGVLPLAAGAPIGCLRSERNFARIVAEERGYQLEDVSCGGASTEDFYGRQHPDTPPQFDALSDSTDLVTLMIGGNDSDVFASAISSCVSAALRSPGADSPCADQYGTSFEDTITSRTYPAIRQALGEIERRAPRARVVVVGYQWLLPPTIGCAPQMPVAPGDVLYLRSLQETLNTSIASAAAETDTTFVDMSVVSEGHDGCQAVGTRWAEPLLFSDQFVPVHPNAAGEAAMAAEVEKALAS